MTSYTCPSCDTDNDIELEQLPNRVCDEIKYECAHCGQQVMLGWVAEIEVRSAKTWSLDSVNSCE